MTTETVPTLRFRNDGAMRKRLWTAEAMSHPAKANIYMWQTCIEKYSQVGDTVLDPLAGIGTTLIAALMGRSVICIERETHFLEPMRASWEKMRQHPMLGYTMGSVAIHQGDARDLSWLVPVNCVVTSPPYQVEAPGLPSGTGAGAVSGQHGNRYTRPDAIVTSPSYEGTNIGRAESLGEAPFGGPNSQARGVQYSPNGGDNIGNMRGPAYWEAMTLCYQEMYRVLKPGGILALVLKGFTRDGKYVDLPQQTADLVKSLGFVDHDHWRRELWSLSFWRILQKRRDPQAFDDRLNYEEIWAFRKPEGEGDGVDTVLTSPPYEAAVSDNKEGPGQTSVPGGWKAGTVNKHGGYTRPSVIITSPPYEGSIQGEPGIDWTKVAGGKRDRTKEPSLPSIKASLSGYTRPREACPWHNCQCKLEHNVQEVPDVPR